MRMIQVASDKEIGVWYFDKREQKLIEISQSAMTQMNNGEDIPVVGITAGVGSILTAAGTYLAKQGVHINYGLLRIFICINVLCLYMLSKYYLRKVEQTVEQLGKRYEVTSELLRYISGAGMKIYIMLMLVVIGVFVMLGWTYFLYIETQNIVLIFAAIIGGNVVTMLIVTLHPLQKILFWVKVRKLY